MKNNEIKEITIAENEAYLRQISTPVAIEDDENLKDDIKILEQYCKKNEVLAMAAVQLGIPKRLVYVKNTNLEIVRKSQTDFVSEEEKAYNEAKVLINPTIVNKEGLTEYWEACVSCLDNFGRVLRPYKIDIEYYDINGIKHLETFEGFPSTVLSHEIDHLDGILHIDISEELFQMPEEERKIYRQSHGYKIYSKTGNYDLLKQESHNKKR